MRSDGNVLFIRAGHPCPSVAEAGFAINHEYVDKCWAPVIGQAGVSLLRRLPSMWQNQHLAATSENELADDLRLRRTPLHLHPVRRVMERLVKFGFAEWDVEVHFGHPKAARNTLVVYDRVGALGEADLLRSPERVRVMHEALLQERAREVVALLSPTATAPAERMRGRLMGLMSHSSVSRGVGL